MSPKVWLALAGAAILGLTFYLGKLQERAVNAPAVARATAHTDALEGEKKSLQTELVKSQEETASMRLALQESERTRKSMVADTITRQELLGLDAGGRPILGTTTTTHLATQEDTEAARKATLQAEAASLTQTSKTSSLLADRQTPSWRVAGLDWRPENWTTGDGLKHGDLDGQLGVKFGHFMAYGRQPILKVDAQGASFPGIHPGVGAAWIW